jgi:DNA-binding ferritin-like protein (Dps family)
MFTDKIFENYENYLAEHKDDIGTVEGGLEMLVSDGQFQSYIAALTEGLSDEQKTVIQNVCQRQRETLLEESVQLGPSSTVIAYAVSYFPILTDIYSEPVLSQATVVHPVNKGVLTIPKAEIKGTVNNSDGTTSTWLMPRNTVQIRQSIENITTTAGSASDLYAGSTSSSSLNSSNARVNRRYLQLYSVTPQALTMDVAVDGENECLAETAEVINVRPDARGQINHTFSYTANYAVIADNTDTVVLGDFIELIDAADVTQHGTSAVIGEVVAVNAADIAGTRAKVVGDDYQLATTTVTGNVIGHVDWDTGITTINITMTGLPTGFSSDGTAVANGATWKVVFSPNTQDIGRVKVTLNISGWDVDIDVKDDFEIELQTEQIQDYKDIYNIDLVRTMSEAIKTQIMLNKDFDIAYLLESKHAIMQTNAAYAQIDMDDWKTGADGADRKYRPTNVLDAVKNILPYINSVSRNIYRNFRGYPQYILCGNLMASFLETLQEMAIDFRDVKKGTFGLGSPSVNFARQTIIPCQALEDDRLYLVFKPESNNLSKSVLIDFIYKPIYIIEEITNSQKRTYVKSRTATEIVNDYACGYIDITNMTNYIGNASVVVNV